MKIFYSFGLGLLCASLLSPCIGSAQQAPCPPAGIRTDPAAATNPGGRPNTFNWYSGSYQPATYNGSRYLLNSPYPGVGQEYIELPWLQPANANMDRFQGKIDKPIDGWELIRRDLGYDDANNPAKTTNPTVILYNRYTSMLRVFTAVGDLQASYQLAEIKLSFGTAATNKAATLNRQAALGVALEDTEAGTNPAFVAIARYLNGRSKWFVADFPMDYDPCICQFDSRLAIEVSLISQANVQLIGKTTGTLVTAGNGTSSTSNDFDKGIPFIRKVNNVLEAGGKSYDNIDKFTSKLSSQNPSKASALTSLNADLKSGSFLKNGLAALPYIGAAVSMLDYFMGGGQDAGPQPVSMQPMAIEMTTTTTGTITAPSLYNTTPMHNPGNRLSVSIPENVPYYNEAMGVFSLLKRPVIESNSTSAQNSNHDLLVTQYYRLAQNLDYVINPAAGLMVQDFQVSLVGETDLETTNGSRDFTSLEGPTIQPDGTSSNLFRTAYFDAACIKNRKFAWLANVTQSPGPNSGMFKTIYLKVLLNLRPIGASSTQQNVLFVARYPVTIQTVTAFATLPVAACGILPQADASTIQAVCTGTKYKTAIVLARSSPNNNVAIGGGPKVTTPELQVYPNPTTGLVRLSYQVKKPGLVRITLSDRLGREVRTLVDQQQVSAGQFEIAIAFGGLQAGIYYCTLHTSTQHKTEKIVITN